jgi:hypothetical protein
MYLLEKRKYQIKNWIQIPGISKVKYFAKDYKVIVLKLYLHEKGKELWVFICQKIWVKCVTFQASKYIYYVLISDIHNFHQKISDIIFATVYTYPF